MNFETWWLKSSSSKWLWGQIQNTSLIVPPWTDGMLFTHKNLNTVPSLFMPTKKILLPVKK